MAKPTKRKVQGGSSVTSGRVTPKGGPIPRTTSARRAAVSSSGRYTAPGTGAQLGPSGRWVPITMFTLLGAGLLMIVVNYMGVILPGAANNWYIFGGLGLILAGIMVATQWR
jgi:hypothetical protein